MQVEQSSEWMSSGFHQIQINMQQNIGERGLQLEVRGPSYYDPVVYRKQPVPASWLWNGNPCGDETTMGVDVPLDQKDLKVPKSPLCGGHGVCLPLCPKSSEHGSCWNHTCSCEAGYQNIFPANGTATKKRNVSASAGRGRGDNTTAVGCELVPPPPPLPEEINGWLVFVLVMVGIGIISCCCCAYHRDKLKQWALWKFASARLYKSFKPAMDHDNEMGSEVDDRSRAPRDGIQSNKGYEAAEI